MEIPSLPEAPESFGKPVPIRKFKAGEDPKRWAGVCYAAVRQANYRLENDRTFYENLQDAYRLIDKGKTNE